MTFDEPPYTVQIPPFFVNTKILKVPVTRPSTPHSPPPSSVASLIHGAFACPVSIAVKVVEEFPIDFILQLISRINTTIWIPHQGRDLDFGIKF